MGHKEKHIKTNAMRELDRAHIHYEVQTYTIDAARYTHANMLGLEIAQLTGVNPHSAFKTLVAQAKNKTYVVLCVPVCCEIDLKQAARAAHMKSLELVAVKELEALTGYIRGGVSPLAMKHRFLTLIDASAQEFDKITISGGKRGVQIRLSPDDLQNVLSAQFADIVRKEA